MKQKVIDVRALQKLKRLSALPPETLARLAANLKTETFKRKTRIFNQDEVADRVFLLVTGVVKLSWVNHAYHRVLVTPLGRGEFFGIGALYPHGRHPYKCDAVTDCLVATFTPQLLVESLMGIRFNDYLRGSEILTGRVWESFSRCIRGMRAPLRKRLALELLDLGSAFGVQDSRGMILGVKITHDDLADSIGFSRQKVTETLTDFEQQGAIIRDGRRLVLNMQKLRGVIEQV